MPLRQPDQEVLHARGWKLDILDIEEYGRSVEFVPCGNIDWLRSRFHWDCRIDFESGANIMQQSYYRFQLSIAKDGMLTEVIFKIYADHIGIKVKPWNGLPDLEYWLPVQIADDPTSDPQNMCTQYALLLVQRFGIDGANVYTELLSDCVVKLCDVVQYGYESFPSPPNVGHVIALSLARHPRVGAGSSLQRLDMNTFLALIKQSCRRSTPADFVPDLHNPRVAAVPIAANDQADLTRHILRYFSYLQDIVSWSCRMRNATLYNLLHVTLG